MLSLTLSALVLATTINSPPGAQYSESKSQKRPPPALKSQELPEAFNCISLPAGIGFVGGALLGAGLCASTCACGGLTIALRPNEVAAPALFFGSAGALVFGAGGALVGALFAPSEEEALSPVKRSPSLPPPSDNAPPPLLDPPALETPNLEPPSPMSY